MLCRENLMSHIIGIAGSLRRASYNAALLRAAVEHAPSNLQVEIASIAGIPLYDGDQEREQGIPAPVSQLKEKIAAADGLLLVTPEYNNSLPGVLKNAIDWLSRPARDITRVFGGKPVGLMGATPGRGGTRLAQTAWLPVLRTLDTRPWFGGQLYIGNAAGVFDEQGLLTDDVVGQQLTTFMRGFADWVELIARGRPSSTE